MKRLFFLLLLCIGLVFSVACGGEVNGNVADDTPSPEADPTPDAAPDSTPDAAPDPTPESPACECADLEICVEGACQPVGLQEPGAEVNTEVDGGCAGSTVSFIAGYVVDDGDRPVSGAKAQACLRNANSGDLLCLSPADSGADGTFGIVVPDNARCSSEVTARVLVPGTDRSTMYCHIALPAEGSTVISNTESIVLYPTTRATDLPEEGVVTDERTVTFADGLQIDVIPDIFFGAGEGYAGLAVGEIAAEDLCFMEGKTADAIYAFSPEGDVLDGAFPIRVPNKTGLAPGAKAVFSVLGGLDCHLPDGELVPEAEWTDYGTGTVDEAGEFIVSDDDGHLPCFTWFGYRAQ